MHRLTVDRLKNVLKHLNTRLHQGHRLSGLKAELQQRVRTALENARNTGDAGKRCLQPLDMAASQK